MRQRSYHFIGRLFSRVPTLARWWGRRFNAVRSDAVPFAPLSKPLRDCRVALVTTGGVHGRDQPPFDMDDPRGDPTFRVISPDTPPHELTITHDYYDRSDAERDLNILYPLGLFNELVTQRAIGSLATGYSFMGHIEPPHVETLLRTSAPTVASKLKQDRVDCVLLTPAWGICNQSVGLIARAIESDGIATVCVIGLKEIAEKVRPPRTLHLKWPFGHPLGEPGNRAQQLTAIHAALGLLYASHPPGTIVEPGWRWRREQYAEPTNWLLGP